jgi:hypothetical protein
MHNVARVSVLIPGSWICCDFVKKMTFEPQMSGQNWYYVAKLVVRHLEIDILHIC